MSVGKTECPAICSIDVKPALMLASDDFKLFERIDHSGRGGAGYSHNTTRQSTFPAILIDCCAKRVSANMELTVSRNLAQSGAAKTEDVSALFD